MQGAAFTAVAVQWHSECLSVSLFLTLYGNDFSKAISIASQFSESRWELGGLCGYKEIFSAIPASSYGEDA